MSVLKDLVPQKVFAYFEALCSIPHGSGNTKGVSDYCAAFAVSHGLRYKQDALNNIIIYKPASAGYEQAPTVILQGHLDMVCVKTAESTVDFLHDGLTLTAEDGYVHAVGTSLGGDDGIAVAIALAILDDDTLAHPPLEALFTVEEETGMDGAQAVDFADLKGRRLINIDSEEEGVITAGCAGGARATCLLPLAWETRRGIRCTLRLEGLQGGHSGTDIHKQKASANVLLGRALDQLRLAAPFDVVSVAGGTVDNAIPVSAQAVLLAESAHVDALMAAAEGCNAAFRREYRVADSGVRLTLTAEQETQERVMTRPAAAALMDALVMLPHGVMVMSRELPGLVQTSLNMGVLRTTAEQVEMVVCLRSNMGTQKAWLCRRLECMMARLSGQVVYTGVYPAWEYVPDSPLRTLAVDCYTRLFGAAPGITATHGGLECGLFCGKEPALECISIGPELLDIHSPRERLSIASTERLYRLVTEILKECRA